MKIDCIIKLGGSLLYDFSKAKKLLGKLGEGVEGNFAVTVGSGELGEMYKSFIDGLDSSEISYRDSVRDYSNVQSINASILSALNDKYVVCENDQQVEEVLSHGNIPIIDARGFIDVFRDDIYQKSDVRSANLCNHFNCKNLIIITNVNGIYDKDPNKHCDSHIIEHITVDKLKEMGRTAVDDGLAERIETYDLNCYVIGIDNVVKKNGIVNEDLLNTGTKIERREKTYAKTN